MKVKNKQRVAISQSVMLLTTGWKTVGSDFEYW
jgi:hypothetical protein